MNKASKMTRNISDNSGYYTDEEDGYHKRWISIKFGCMQSEKDRLVKEKDYFHLCV